MENEIATNITWEAPEFEYHEKGVGWYWTIILVTLILLIVALFQQNFLFAIFIIMAGILAVVWSREMPSIINFSITQEGIGIGDKNIYHYEDLASFSILEHRHGTELVLKRKNNLSQPVKIPLEEGRAEAIQAIMREKLPEKDFEESLPDSIFRFIKF